MLSRICLRGAANRTRPPEVGGGARGEVIGRATEQEKEERRVAEEQAGGGEKVLEPVVKELQLNKEGTEKREQGAMIVNDFVFKATSELSRRQQNRLSDAVATARADGCGPKESARRLLLSHLLRVAGSRGLAEMNVCLFNCHSTRLAERLLSGGVGQLTLLESGQQHARVAKDLAKTERKKGRLVAAFRTEHTAVIGGGRSVAQVAPALVGCQMRPYAPLTLNRETVEGESPIRGPVIVGCLPLPVQQQNAISSLTRSVIAHHTAPRQSEERGRGEKGRGYVRKDKPSNLFEWGEARLVTFLHANVLASLLSARDERLGFIAHRVRREAMLFDKLFRLEYVTGEGKQYSPFARSEFDPAIPPQKVIAHEKKIAELCLVNNQLYPVSIRPRTRIGIGGRWMREEGEGEGEGTHLPVSSLLSYAFYCDLLAGQTASAKAGAVVGRLFPSVRTDLAESQLKMAEIPSSALDALFVECHSVLPTHPHFRRFTDQFKTAKNSDFAD